MSRPEGARYEIAIDGTPRSHRDREDYALQTATLSQNEAAQRRDHRARFTKPAQ